MENDKDKLKELLAKLNEDMAHTKELKPEDYPVAISGVQVGKPMARKSDIPVGTWVSVRPCGKHNPEENKTFLGVYLGELLTNMHESLVMMDDRTSKLFIGTGIMPNPAIYVPDLKRVEWGCGSWWGVIESPEELKQISDQDIENVWYVQALKALSEQGKEDDGVRVYE